MGPLIMDFEASGMSSGVALVPASLVIPLSSDDPILASAPTEPVAETSPTPQLSRNWRQAIDNRGRTYYYHAMHRISQWEPPLPDEETPDFSSEEETEPEEEDATPPEAAVLTEITVCENSKSKEQIKKVQIRLYYENRQVWIGKTSRCSHWLYNNDNADNNNKLLLMKWPEECFT